MWPYRVSNPGPLTCESGALPIALRGPFKLGESLSQVQRYHAYEKLSCHYVGQTDQNTPPNTLTFDLRQEIINTSGGGWGRWVEKRGGWGTGGGN